MNFLTWLCSWFRNKSRHYHLHHC